MSMIKELRYIRVAKVIETHTLKKQNIRRPKHVDCGDLKYLTIGIGQHGPSAVIEVEWWRARKEDGHLEGARSPRSTPFHLIYEQCRSYPCAL